MSRAAAAALLLLVCRCAALILEPRKAAQGAAAPRVAAGAVSSGDAASDEDDRKILAALPATVLDAVSSLRNTLKSKRNSADDGADAAEAAPTCIEDGAKSVSRESLLHPEKYKERAADEKKCETGVGMWGQAHTVPVRAKKYMTIAKFFNLGPSARVLDWGTGCGRELEGAAAQMHFQAFGIDVVEELVEFAQQNTKSNATYCLANGGAALPFDDNVFDVVFSNAALYHVNGLENEKSAMNYVLRVLVPGGCAWMGWLGADDDPVSMQAWQNVTLDDAVVGVVREQDLYEATEYDKDSYALIACKKL